MSNQATRWRFPKTVRSRNVSSSGPVGYERMAIAWEAVQVKRKKLGRVLLTGAELRTLEEVTADILGIATADRTSKWAEALGYGARTRAIIRVRPPVCHRFMDREPNVLVKLFKGPAEPYRRFHRDYFPRLPVVPGNVHFQQTLEAGRWREGQAYAVLQFVDGTTLRSRLSDGPALAAKAARSILQQIFARIWIPTWDTGLRFRDCHPGNFIVRPSGMAVTMIDVEQMRNGAFELLDTPRTWTARDAHEQLALRQVSGVFQAVLAAQTTGQTGAKIRRSVNSALVDTELREHLARLGRGRPAPALRKAAADALHTCLERLL